MRTSIVLCVFLIGCGGRVDNGNGNGSGSGSGSGNGSGNGSGSGSGSGCGSGMRIASSAQEPRRVATDGAFVYWTTWGDTDQKNGSVWRAPVTGGEAEKLAGDVAVTTDITTDDTHVFWVGHGTHLASVSKAGGGMTILAMGSVEHVVIDSGFAYFSRPDGVFRVPTGGGAETRITEGDGVDPLAISDQVYFVERGTGVLRAVSKTGGVSHVIASDPALTSAYDLAAGEHAVFGVTTDAGVVWRADDAGITPIAKGFHCPAGIATTGSDVLFANESIACDDQKVYGERTIQRIRGGKSTEVASAEHTGITGFATDGVNVYWGGNGIWCARL